MKGIKGLKIPKFGDLKIKKSVVVVEIGNDWLKVVENTPSPVGRYISRARFVKLAQIKEDVSSAIADIFRTMKLSKDSVVISIPRHLVTVRALELPSLDPNEIKEIVDLQISKQTPYSKEEIISSHRTVDSLRQGYTRVILAIATRNIISERVLTMEKAGIAVHRVALSTEGACNWFDVAYMQSSVELQIGEALILVDIDSNYSDFIVIRQKKLVFTRNIFIGANHLMEPQGDWQSKFLDELKHSIERYQGEEKNIILSKIYLSGAARNINDLDRRLSSELGVPVEIAHLAKNIRLGKEVDILEKEDYKLVSSSPVFGTAIRHKELSFDLIPSELRVHKLMEEKRKSLTLMGILFAAIVTMLSFMLLINVYGKNNYLSQIKKKIANIEKESSKIKRMRTSVNLIEDRLDARGSSLDILNEIYRLTTKEIYFVNISIEEKLSATLRGRAFEMSGVFEFVTTLENSPYFENVKTTYTTTKTEQGVEYAEFEIICAYQGGQ